MNMCIQIHVYKYIYIYIFSCIYLYMYIHNFSGLRSVPTLARIRRLAVRIKAIEKDDLGGPWPPCPARATTPASLRNKSPFLATLETAQGQIDVFFSQLPFKCNLPGGGICGRLTQDLPLGCLQSGSWIHTDARRDPAACGTYQGTRKRQFANGLGAEQCYYSTFPATSHWVSIFRSKQYHTRS